MTVRELIEALQKLDPEATVYRADGEYMGFLAEEVRVVTDLERKYLEGGPVPPSAVIVL